MTFWRSTPTLTLGTNTYGFPLFPGRVTLRGNQLETHRHLIGVAGVGKSKLLESIFLQLFRQGIGVTLLDPHADGAESILATLLTQGFFARSDAADQLLYIAFSDTDYFLPFNVLHQPNLEPHAIASNILEACHRAWPALADGVAPQFDNLLLASVLVAIENHLPLPALHRLLTDKPYRDGMLCNVSDMEVVSFFKDRFDKWSRYEAPQMIESTLRRVFLMTFSPTLRFSLGQTKNALDFRQIIDRGQSVIFNLGGVHDAEARRLLGCLITIGYETAALSRTDLPAEARRPHHLLLDEFSDYSAQSEEALSRTLSLTRKFGLFSTMAHQTWSQASVRLQGALQNVGVRIALRVGRADAEILARQLGHVDPQEVKSEALTQTSQPIFMELAAQWEEIVQTLTDLPARQAMVKVSGRRATYMKTLNVPYPRIDPQQLEKVKQDFRHRLMVPRSAIDTNVSPPPPTTQAVRTVYVKPT